MVDSNKSPLANLVSAKGYQEMKVNFTPPGTETYVTGISVGERNLDLSEFDSDGKLKGLIESFGSLDENGKVSGAYPDMLSELDNLAYTFAVEFNNIHSDGMSPNEINHVNADGEIEPVNEEIPFFGDKEFGALTEDHRAGFSGRIDLSEKIKASLDNIANADGANPDIAETGDSSVLLKLADLINQDLDYGQNSQKASFRNYYEVLIGGMAVDTQNAVRLTDNSGTLRQAVDERRMSTSAVSLDEEMTNMIQFQHAYNASARMISLQDELLDKIINGMGTGGR